MNEEHERETPFHPIPVRDDGWWHTIIEAVLEEMGEPREERDRGAGR